jgi:RNA polymerase sigma-70 factor (ECF subfamily)
MASASFASFYEETSPDVYAFGFLLAGSAGEDFAAEAYARALARWREVGGYDRPDAWVRRVIVNQHISRARKQRLQDLFVRRASIVDMPSHADQAETSFLVRSALQTLSPQQRAVVIFRYFGDLSLEETARTLNCSVSTVNTHLRRAHSRLRTVLGDAYLVPSGQASQSDPSSSPRQQHLTSGRR